MPKVIRFCDLVEVVVDLTWIHVYVEYYDCSSGDCVYDKLVSFDYCVGLSDDSNYSKYADCEVRYVKNSKMLEVCLNYYF